MFYGSQVNLWRWRLEAKANCKQKSAAGTRYHSSLQGHMHEARIMYWLFLVLLRFGIDSLYWHLRRSLPTSLSTYITNLAFFLFETNHKFHACFIKIEGLGVMRLRCCFVAECALFCCSTNQFGPPLCFSTWGRTKAWARPDWCYMLGFHLLSNV